ncbi:MAG: hypothetical protein E7309_16000 [Butyrivibrio sp.]|jgi:hypothetical protein|nr:hypothetical protein [Butyrivibrio sp.]
MNKTKIIKDTIGKTLEKQGFGYIRKEQGVVWTFGRTVNSVEQNVYVQQHTIFSNEYKLIFWSSAKGNGVKEIGSVLAEYANREYWTADTDEDFFELMKFFSNFIEEYGFDLLKNMLEEKEDTFETLERKQYFKEHRKELVDKYDKTYHVLGNGSREEQLKHIDEILWENREADDSYDKQQEIYELWLGMAALLTEIILNEEGGKVSYDTWKVEIKRDKRVLEVRPIDTVVQAWLRYHMNDKSIMLVWAMAR